MGTHAVDHPRLLPAVLVPDREAGAPLRRTTRDWVVDWSMFLLALVFGFLFWVAEMDRGVDDRLMVVDALVGLLCCAALWGRRRWPVALGVLTIPVGVVSSSAGAAAIMILFTLAVHRRWPVAVTFAAIGLATIPAYLALRPEDDLPVWAFTALAICLSAAVIAWGMFVRARRQLVLSLRERARRAEAEQSLRVDQARQAERARIAREMHDVLAHRVSLISLHAGALEFRPDAPQDEVARAAGIIRASAHQALGDLREVIGVLRDTSATPAADPEPPQPTLVQLPALLDESREAGMKVDADVRVADPSAVPASIGRSALRIVQEGLTNARKHAPGAKVAVVVDGSAGQGLTVEVRNPAWVHTPAIPGTGTGLIGLSERASLAGGTLEHGVTEDGEFRLRATLPWPA